MIRKTLLLLLSLFLGCPGAMTQSIKRKGKLGVQIKAAPNNEQKLPYAIAQVLPGSTAENLGLKAGDILWSLNGQIIQDGPALGQVIQGFYAGELAQAKIIRAKKVLELSGKITAPPLPVHSPQAEILLKEVPFRQGKIRAIVNKPQGDGPFPALYYLQGYPCQTIDYNPQHPTIQMIEAMVDAGFAVYRIEKPGVGEYVNCAPCRDMTFEDELEGFRNGYQDLQSQDFVQKDQIYLFGHSLGGNVAPILAQEFEPAGLMVYGTSVKPWADYLIDMARYSQPMMDEDLFASENKIPQLKAIHKKIYKQEVPIEQLSDEEKQVLSYYQDYQEGGFLFDRRFEFWKSFQNQDYIRHWSQVKSPVLALYGEADVHAISGLDAEHISRIVNLRNPGKAQYRSIPETDHFFLKVGSKMNAFNHLKYGTLGQVLYKDFNPEIPQVILEWIQEAQKQEESQAFRLVNQYFPQELSHKSTMDVESADLDGNGYPDLVLATEFGPNRIFFNQLGSFAELEDKKLPQLKTYTPPYQGEDSEDIAISDFDQDGDLDLLFVSEDTENHELLYNDGVGNFEFAPQQLPKIGDANAVLLYDFNADQYPDVLLGIRGQNELYINQKGKGFENKTKELWPKNEDSTQDLILVDVDGDGDLDIIEGIEQGGSNLYLNEKGRFKEDRKRLPNLEAFETRKVAHADVDGDGDEDLFFCNVGWQGKDPQNRLLLNDGAGNFEDVSSSSLPQDLSTTLDAIFTDLNGDGKLDLITTGLGESQNLKTFINQSKAQQVKFVPGEGIFPPLRYSGGISMILDDFNRDGKRGLYLGNHKFKDFLLLEI